MLSREARAYAADNPEIYDADAARSVLAQSTHSLHAAAVRAALDGASPQLDRRGRLRMYLALGRIPEPYGAMQYAAWRLRALTRAQPRRYAPRHAIPDEVAAAVPGHILHRIRRITYRWHYEFWTWLSGEDDRPSAATVVNADIAAMQITGSPNDLLEAADWLAQAGNRATLPGGDPYFDERFALTYRPEILALLEWFVELDIAVYAP